MKTAVSIPNALFQAADRLAKRLGWSRSELYARALAEFLARSDRRTVTETLNVVYDGVDPSRLDPAVRDLQDASLQSDDEW